MDVISDRRDNVLFVGVSGRLESADAVSFEKTVRTAVEDGDRAMIMDLGALTYISSAGLRAVFMTASTLEKRSVRFALCSLPDTVQKVFRLSGMDQLITVHPTKADALASLQSAAT